MTSTAITDYFKPILIAFILCVGIFPNQIQASSIFTVYSQALFCNDDIVETTPVRIRGLGHL